MRRTLLAIGFAVLVSMMLAPHGDRSIAGWGPFVSRYGFDLRFGTVWFHDLPGRVMIDMLTLQTIFLAVLFAVLVNLRKSWRLKPKQV
jgi:hypothetical protein